MLVSIAAETVAETSTIDQSVRSAIPPPQWPRAPEAPRGAPNVLLIMTDDVGFGASGSFGGPIPTPTLDTLARNGLRYNRFHTTAICSPTRASLLTGRNPHNVGMGNATNLPTGYDGYTSVIPDSAGTVARVLTDAGYSSAMFGKAHITPEWETGPTGPFDRWPTGLGFQHFYGFLNADTSMFEPTLVDDTRFVDRPRGDETYHFEKDIADKAIAWIKVQKSVRPDKPVFVYYAPASAHAPHHAPPEWLAKFRGRFDQGWDAVRQETFQRQKAAGLIPANTELTPRPAQLPAWSTLSADQKRLGTRLMEAYAAALAYADHEVGRVVDAMQGAGEPGDTMVIYIQGDNGSSPEGGINGLLFEQSQINGLTEDLAYALAHSEEIGSEKAYNTYPAGWGWAMNTPFQWYKRVGSHFGGTRNGMVISWPGHIDDPGSVRAQFHHVSDIMPTILEAARIAAPASIDGVQQKPLDGISMAYTFKRGAPDRRTQQIFEMMENMGLYNDGWMLSSTPVVIPWALDQSPKVELADRRWELYDIRSDFSQAHDLAGTEPVRLKQMQQEFWRLAQANAILPIHGLTEGRQGMPDPSGGRSELVFHAGQSRIPEYAGLPSLGGRSFSITADVLVKSTSRGVLAAQGGRFGGYALYLQDGHLIFHYNALGSRQYTVRSQDRVPPGTHRLVARFSIDQPRPRSGGSLKLLVDDFVVGSGRIETTLRRISHTEGFDVGLDTVTPVTGDYSVSDSAFDGELTKLTLKLE